MSKTFWFITCTILPVLAVLPYIVFFHSAFSSVVYSITPKLFSLKTQPSITAAEELRIVGDVMLGRHVETLMRIHGPDYPYQHLASEPGVVWMGNFEGTVPDRHTQTPNYTFSFSVDRSYLPALRRAGFQYLSLANNHSNDFGSEVLVQTRDNLSDFNTFGDPKTPGSNSVTYLALGDTAVGMIALNLVGHEYDHHSISKLLYDLTLQSDMQIAYIHWGDEYAIEHNEFQATVAKTLIDNGIDMVVGHHPHVVQDIELYKNRPIFYSLGNFIFDQYFDPAVQEGLVIALYPVGDKLEWELLPVSTAQSPAAPQVLTGRQRGEFLSQLAKRSDPDIFVDLLEGRLTLAK